MEAITLRKHQTIRIPVFADGVFDLATHSIMTVDWNQYEASAVEVASNDCVVRTQLKSESVPESVSPPTARLPGPVSVRARVRCLDAEVAEVPLQMRSQGGLWLGHTDLPFLPQGRVTVVIRTAEPTDLDLVQIPMAVLLEALNTSG